MPLPTRHLRSARAMTLVEVVLAVLLLSMTIGVVMGAVSSIAGMESRGRLRLAASEVANRLMLQFLDDEKAMPSKMEALEYGRYRFLWQIDKTIATMAINRKQESAGANLQKLDRYQLICITVYEAEQEGNFEIKGEPLAYITRIIDPYAPRNPDSVDAFGGDLARIQDLIKGIVDTAGPESGPAKLQGRQLR